MVCALGNSWSKILAGLREDINRKKHFLSTFWAYDWKKNLMLIMKVAMIIMMIIMVIFIIFMTKMTKKHTITVKFE